MAVEILVGHIPAATAIAALAQVHSEHAALYSGIEPVDQPRPASTSFTATNSGNVSKGKINGLPVMVTCTGSKLNAKTRASGLTANLTSTPTFTGCKDNFGGTDTITTSGTWSMTLIDNAGATASEPNAGDRLTFNIPAGGAKFMSSLLRAAPLRPGRPRRKPAATTARPQQCSPMHRPM